MKGSRYNLCPIQFVPDTVCSRYNLFPIQFVSDTNCADTNCADTICADTICSRYNLCQYNLYMNHQYLYLIEYLLAFELRAVFYHYYQELCCLYHNYQ